MADERSTGIILRTRLLTETSLIVHWLTPDLGRLATVAKGALRPKSNFRGKLDLFYIADFSFARSARSDLHTLREVLQRETHAALREDITRVQQASYASALIEQATETETPMPEIFELMRRFLGHIAAHKPTAASVFAFELKLLDHLGFSPDLGEAHLSPGGKKIAERLLAEDWQTVATLVLTPAQVEELRKFLHGFIIYHLERIPRGRTEALHA